MPQNPIPEEGPAMKTHRPSKRSRKPVTEEKVVQAMQKLFDCTEPFEPALRVAARASRPSEQPLNADALIARVMDLERCLCSLSWSILLLRAWEHKDGMTEERLQVKTLKNMGRLHEEVIDLQEILRDIRHWRVVAANLEKEDADAYRKLIQAFKMVFPALKKKKSSNFVYGSSEYLKALKLAVRGAWMGRSLSRSKDVTPAMDLAIEDLDNFVEFLTDRAKDRGVDEHWKGEPMTDEEIEAYDDEEDVMLGLYDEVDADGCEEDDAAGDGEVL